jgi:hypothetical protein
VRSSEAPKVKSGNQHISASAERDIKVHDETFDISAENTEQKMFSLTISQALLDSNYRDKFRNLMDTPDPKVLFKMGKRYRYLDSKGQKKKIDLSEWCSTK